MKSIEAQLRNSFELAQHEGSAKSSRRYGGGTGRDATSQSAIKVPKLLPTLGLTKYQNIDLSVNHLNPYTTHDRVEDALVNREREREFQYLAKQTTGAYELKP